MSASDRPAPNSVLPPWLYPAAFWVVVALLALGLVWPAALNLGVLALLASPVVAALIVVFTHWRRDRRLAVAALLALTGLALIFVLRQFIG